MASLWHGSDPNGAVSGPFQYRYILGDTTNLNNARGKGYIEELIREKVFTLHGLAVDALHEADISVRITSRPAGDVGRPDFSAAIGGAPRHPVRPDRLSLRLAATED
jgi:hypothetical protein